jgi:hypothetical protein
VTQIATVSKLAQKQIRSKLNQYQYALKLGMHILKWLADANGTGYAL